MDDNATEENAVPQFAPGVNRHLPPPMEKTGPSKEEMRPRDAARLAIELTEARQSLLRRARTCTGLALALTVALGALATLAYQHHALKRQIREHDLRLSPEAVTLGKEFRELLSDRFNQVARLRTGGDRAGAAAVCAANLRLADAAHCDAIERASPGDDRSWLDHQDCLVRVELLKKMCQTVAPPTPAASP